MSRSFGYCNNEWTKISEVCNNLECGENEEGKISLIASSI